MKTVSEYMQLASVIACRVLLPLIYILFAFSNWDDSTIQLDRLVFCNSLMLVLGLDSCLIFYRIMRNSSLYEYEICLFQSLIYLINFFQGEQYELAYMNFYEIISYYLFFFIFWFNLICIGILSIILFAFVCFVLMVDLSGDQNLNLNRGLNEQEISKLQTLTYEEFLKQNEGKNPQPPSTLQPQQQANKKDKSFNKNNIHNNSHNNNNLSVAHQNKSHSHIRRHSIVSAANKSQHSIKSINVLLNSLSISLGDKDKCSICLIDYDKDEILIVLPKCKHYFHQDCIKLWFQSNSKCPFCRDNIILRLQE